MIVLYQVVVNILTLNVYGTVITLLFGLMTYTEACLLDIKSQFDQMDLLSKKKHPKILMLALCKEAVELHGRLNG